MNRINLISLGVKDIKKSLEFYKKLALQHLKKKKTHLSYFLILKALSYQFIHLMSYELAKDINREAPPSLSQGGFNGITLACNMKPKQDVDRALALVEHHGGTIVNPHK